jgi:DNA-3-methyladenine glycosylase
MGDLLEPAFFARDVVTVAKDLVGCEIWRDGVGLRITETEAYAGPGDTASHSHRRRTPRNEPMWGPQGRLYVYVCYGIHPMLNLVAHDDGAVGAALIRSAEVIDGLEIVLERRGRAGKGLTAGPGKVGQALALDPTWSHHDGCAPGGVELRSGRAATRIGVGARIGVDYADPAHRDAPWRFGDIDGVVTWPKRLSIPAG